MDNKKLVCVFLVIDWLRVYRLCSSKVVVMDFGSVLSFSSIRVKLTISDLDLALVESLIWRSVSFRIWRKVSKLVSSSHLVVSLPLTPLLLFVSHIDQGSICILSNLCCNSQSI